MSENVNKRQERSSTPEDLFAHLFTEAFGLDKAQLLVPEHQVNDIYDNIRYIDFALMSSGAKIAFEIDGLTWHVPIPNAQRISKYEDDLLRQNSLIHKGWHVFRWTDRQIANESERIKEELRLFLESVPGLLEFDDFLPVQRGEIVELREHQKEALSALEELRTKGNTIALIPHATGTGKTVPWLPRIEKQHWRSLQRVSSAFSVRAIC
jgi:hypothetical protein